MFKWIKKLFGKKQEDQTGIKLMLICETIKPTKPIKRRKRDSKGRFTK